MLIGERQQCAIEIRTPVPRGKKCEVARLGSPQIQDFVIHHTDLRRYAQSFSILRVGSLIGCHKALVFPPGPALAFRLVDQRFSFPSEREPVRRGENLLIPYAATSGGRFLELVEEGKKRGLAVEESDRRGDDVARVWFGDSRS